MITDGEPFSIHMLFDRVLAVNLPEDGSSGDPDYIIKDIDAGRLSLDERHVRLMVERLGGILVHPTADGSKTKRAERTEIEGEHVRKTAESTMGEAQNAMTLNKQKFADLEPIIRPDGIYWTPLYMAIGGLALMAPIALGSAELDGRDFNGIISFVFARLPPALIDINRVRSAVHKAGCYGNYHPEDVADDDVALRCYIRESLIYLQTDDDHARGVFRHEILDDATVRRFGPHLLRRGMMMSHPVV